MKRWWHGVWRSLGWPAAILAVSLLIGLLAGPARTGSALDPDSARTHGMRALVLYLKESGWVVRPSVTDPKQVSPRQGVLFVAPEVLGRADRGEGQSLTDWVGQGGLLVLLGAADRGALQTPARFEEVGPKEAVLDGGSPSLGGARRLFTPTGSRWSPSSMSSGAGWQAGAVAQGAPLLAIRQAPGDGPGRLVALAEPLMLDNQALPQKDNLAFALALVEDSQRREWGYYTGDPMAALRQQMAGDQGPRLPLSWRLLLWGLGLAAVAGLWLTGRRTGPVLPPAPQPPRPGVEFLVAQAHAYRRAGAATGVLGYLLRAFRRDLAHRTGLPPGALAAVLAGASRGLGLEPEAVQSLLSRAENFLSRRLTNKQLLALARELAAMHRRMRNARS